MAVQNSVESDSNLTNESKEFLLLKPYCAEVLRTPSQQNLQRLSDILETVTSVEGKIFEYVIFPIAVHLKYLTRLKENERIGLFTCLGKISAKGEVKSYDLFVELFQRLNVALVSVDNPATLNAALSEEELDSITGCTAIFLKNSLAGHVEYLYDENRIKVVGFFIFIMLELINRDTKIKIRLAALEILEILVGRCAEYPSLCNRMLNFFPGIVSNLRHTCSTKKGRVYNKLVLKAVSVLELAIKVCISNTEAEKLVQADQNLTQVLSVISEELVVHPTISFRKSLLDFSVGMILPMSIKLKECVDVLWKNIWILRSDAEEIICDSAKSFLNSCKRNDMKVFGFDPLMKLTTRSISLLEAGDDTGCLLSLKHIASLLTVMKIDFAELRVYYPVLHSLAAQCLTLKEFNESESYQNHVNPVLRTCTQICQNVFLAANIDDALDEFANQLSQFDRKLDNSISNGTIFCFIEFLRAYNLNLKDPNALYCCRNIDPYEIVNFATILVTILDAESTEIVLFSLTEEKPRLQSQAEVRKALLLDGLSVLSQISPAYVLPISLYSLIESAGTKEFVIVSSVALNSLQNIVNSMQQQTIGSIEQFMSENIDLIMSELSVRILNLSLHPNCPNALLFLSNYFDFSASDFVNMVEEIFEKSCDYFNGGTAQIIYVKVFYSFVASLWIQKQTKESSGTASTIEDSATPAFNFSTKQGSNIRKTMYQRLLDYQTAVGIVDDYGDGSSIPVEEIKEDDSVGKEKLDEDEPVLEADLNLVLKISRRVLNFLPNSERHVRLVSMDCLVKCLMLLQDHENSLLPLAHTIWQNLIPRFSEKDYVVVRKSFELLLTLCSACGTFLKKRTLAEVLPKLSVQLVTLAKESLRVRDAHRQYYTYTQAYKLQLVVLQGMFRLCECIEIQEQDLRKVVEGALMYMEPQQHKNLKDAAKALLDCIASGPNCRSVWLLLVANGLQSIPQKTHADFLPLPPELKILQKEKEITE